MDSALSHFKSLAALKNPKARAWPKQVRVEAARLYAAGYTVKTLNQLCGAHVSTIRSWIKSFSVQDAKIHTPQSTAGFQQLVVVPSPQVTQPSTELPLQEKGPTPSSCPEAVVHLASHITVRLPLEAMTAKHWVQLMVAAGRCHV